MPAGISPVENPADFTLQEAESGELVVFFRGDLDSLHIAPLWEKIIALLDEREPSGYVLDFQQAGRFDTAGMALLRIIEDRCRKKRLDCKLRNLPEPVGQFLRDVSRQPAAEERPEAPAGQGLIAGLGIWGREKLEHIYEIIRFFGDFVSTTAGTLSRPHRIIFSDFLYHLQKIGADAVPIVFALSALLGLVIVFQGIATSTKLGSNIFIADMVTVSVTKQMAPLITAIIISGRSGAAFAAEIGSMKLRQELDVLSVMDFDITRFLVLPRVFAMVVAAPLLTMISDLAGILGGMLTSKVVLGLSPIRFITEVSHALTPPNIYTGLIKGAGFGYLVGMTGCYHGLRTLNTADSVGAETTSAVVSGILFIILADSLFAALFSRFGW